MTFLEAENWCIAQGSSLVSIHSAEQNAAATAVCSTRCWIGLHCIDNNQFDFEWTDGSAWNYTNWNNGEPNNNANTDEDCVHIYPGNGFWNDNPCSDYFLPLCAASQSMFILTSLSICLDCQN